MKFFDAVVGGRSVGTPGTAKLLETAHKKGIRIVMDAVINHTGPVTFIDPVWPEDWVRTSPKCTYESYETSITSILTCFPGGGSSCGTSDSGGMYECFHICTSLY